MYYISLCLIIKDDHDYIREFLHYYFLLGFDHIYLTDNNSSPPLKNIIQDYIDKGLVSYNYDTRKGAQISVYSECLNLYKNDTKWLAFFDSDEFLVLKKHSNIVDFLKSYEDYAALSVCWYYFGSSNHIKKQKSIIQSYTLRAKRSCYYKTIVQTQLVEGFEIHCVTKHKPGYFTVDEQKRRVHGPQTVHQTNEFCQLNHYVVRSFEDYQQKIARGDAAGLPPKPEDFFDKINERATVFDDSIFDFLYPKYQQFLSTYFDWESYLINNPQVAAISNTKEYALEHWYTLGDSKIHSYARK